MLCCVIPPFSSWGRPNSAYRHKISWMPVLSLLYLLWSPHTVFHLCFCHSISAVTLCFHFNTLIQFLILSLSICLHNPAHPESSLLIFLVLTLYNKYTQLSVIRAQQSCRKWILKGQFHMSGWRAYRWLCYYFWVRLLLASSTLNNAVGLFDWRLINEAGVLGVTRLQDVPFFLVSRG